MCLFILNRTVGRISESLLSGVNSWGCGRILFKVVLRVKGCCDHARFEVPCLNQAIKLQWDRVENYFCLPSIVGVKLHHYIIIHLNYYYNPIER
jgi:hypothetical protein